MSIKSLQNSTERYHLSRQNREELAGLNALLKQFAPAKLHQLIGLPDEIRIREIEEVNNYRMAVLVLLRSKMGELSESEEASSTTLEMLKQVDDRLSRINEISRRIDGTYSDDDNGKNGNGGDNGGIHAA
jgi:hypothetical protein